MTPEPAPRATDAMPDAAALEREFDVLMARAGLTAPIDRRPALLAAFKELREQVALLRHAGRTAAAEPSNVFRLPFPAGGVGRGAAA